MIKGKLQLPDGRKLAWRETGSGPEIVLLHGWTMTGAVFAEFAGCLEQDFRLLLPDLPGHGGSDPPDDVSLGQMADDLSAWLQVVAPRPCLIAGWSLGGMVALNLVAAFGLVPEGLVMMATTPRFTQAEDWPHGLPCAEVHVLERNLKRNFDATLGQFFGRMFVEEELSAERLRAIRQFAVYGETRPDADCARRLLQIFAGQDQRGLLPKVPCPVFVVHGEKDVITPVGAGRWLADASQHARAEFLPGVGHAPFLSHPEEIAAMFRRFVQWLR